MKKILPLTCLSLLLISSVDAGIVDASKPEVSVPTLSRHTTKAVSQLRCWQQGKMVFEELNWVKPDFEKSSQVSFDGNASVAEKMTVFSLGESICTYRSAQ